MSDTKWVIESLQRKVDAKTAYIIELEATKAELLAACQGLLSIYDRYTGVGLQEVDAARAAIRKVVGSC
jgi:hypothetical protein